MTNQNSHKKILAESQLGKKSEYQTNYNPALLFPIPRAPQRKGVAMQAKSGYDFWTAYELSWLNNKGKPIIAIAHFKIPFNTTNIIESKSFKLYLNSFNNEKIESIEKLKEIIEKDLNNAAWGDDEAKEKNKEKITLEIIPAKQFGEYKFQELNGVLLDELDIQTDPAHINPEKSYLKLEENVGKVKETLYSNLLKSNCPVTNQPDWASVQIEYEGNKINHEGLLKYIISFRNHNDFHEHCAENIYADIMQICKPEKLNIYARYTRRGGLDINPYRSSEENNTPQNLNRGARQ